MKPYENDWTHSNTLTDPPIGEDRKETDSSRICEKTGGNTRQPTFCPLEYDNDGKKRSVLRASKPFFWKQLKYGCIAFDIFF